MLEHRWINFSSIIIQVIGWLGADVSACFQRCSCQFAQYGFRGYLWPFYCPRNFNYCAAAQPCIMDQIRMSMFTSCNNIVYDSTVIALFGPLQTMPLGLHSTSYVPLQNMPLGLYEMLYAYEILYLRGLQEQGLDFEPLCYLCSGNLGTHRQVLLQSAPAVMTTHVLRAIWISSLCPKQELGPRRMHSGQR